MLNDCDSRPRTGWVSWKRRTILYPIRGRSSREIATLVGLGPSDNMRRHRLLPRSAWVVAALLAATPGFAGGVPVADSASVQSELPVPEDDLETLEPLEEDRSELHAGSIVRWRLTRGALRLRRVAADLDRGGARAGMGLLVDPDRVRPGARLALKHGVVEMAGGRVSLARLPPLLADAMSLTRSGRRVPAPRAGSIGMAPSLGASAGAIDGGAFQASGLWSFAGVRGESRERLAGAGLRVARRGARASASVGVTGTARHGSLTVETRGLGIEVLAGTYGRALLADVVSRGEGAILSARWRYRSWMDRTAAAELSAASRGVRMTWRSWSQSATLDDGLLELEWNGAPMKVRLGAAGDREQYALLDATVAREAGRSLSLHAMRRAARAGGRTASGTTVGARLDVRGKAGSHALVIESTRIRRGAPAWGVALAPSGDVTLRSRSKPGLTIAARGALGAGRWKVGYALERGEDDSGPGPWSGALWIGRSRD